MKMQIQVTGPGTSLMLKKLGVKYRSAYLWKVLYRKASTVDYDLVPSSVNHIFSDPLHCYTLSELGILIPWGFFQSVPIQKAKNGIWFFQEVSGKVKSFASEIEARAYFLIYLITSHQITIKEVNSPVIYNQPVTKEIQD